jgi:alpha-L-rhamnosidase
MPQRSDEGTGFAEGQTRGQKSETRNSSEIRNPKGAVRKQAWFFGILASVFGFVSGFGLRTSLFIDRRSVCPKVVATLLSLLLLGSSAEAALAPTRLKCEFAENPLGIDVPQPRLSWQVSSAERGERQTAYQILVATSTNLLARDAGDLWDSGKVVSDETLHLRYAGTPLTTSQQVWWQVRVWDRGGAVSEWSAPASWTMGVLGTNDWQAVWVCAPAATEALLLRREFEVKPGLKRAVVHVSGLGQYELMLNGTKAGDDFLSPGWTDYNDTVLCDTKDVTPLLREGRNAAGMTLGNGMYNVVRRNRFVKFTGSFGALRAICQLELEYADGSRQIVGTDESWRTSAGPITFSSIFGGEDFDARLSPNGWDRAGFDDSAWRPAVQLVRPPGALRGLSVAAPPLREIEIHRPISVRPLTNGNTLYDLGQNASHILRLRVTGPAGSSVRIIPSEILGDDGAINQKTMGAGKRGSSWWDYTLAGSPKSEVRNPNSSVDSEVWAPRFNYVGCRYFQVRLTPAQPGGPRPQVQSLDGVVVHSSAAPVGEFECSNDLLNRTRDLVRWAQRANMVSVLTDCPHREKLGWLEQYHLNGPAIRYEFDVNRIFTKGMNDMADAQLKNGLVPNIAPEYTVFDGTFRAAAEWGSAFILVPWQQYQFAADLDLARAHYDRMKRYVGYLESIATNDIVGEGLGDWYDLVPGRRPGAAALTPPPVTASAFYFHDAQVLSRMAELLGEPDEARVFAAHAGRIRQRYNARFYNPTNATYATGSQCANALALVMGIVDPQHRDAVLAALVRDVESRGYAVTAGDVGFRYLLQALAQGGRSDVIYRMITQTNQPGYGYMLKKGATSLTEAWDANPNSSHNHFMLGQITEWFYKDLAGIDCDPAGPGFKQIIIRPQPVGDLKWVRARYDSVRGKISSEWHRDGDKFTLKITIPANTTANVFLPAKSAESVTESGQAAAQSPGVKFLRMEHGAAVFAAESGQYEFVAR